MAQYQKVDRDRVIEKLERDLGRSLRSVNSYQTIYEDEEGRAYFVLGGTGKWHAIKKSQYETLRECPKTGLLVVALKEDKQIGVYAQNLGPFLDRVPLPEEERQHLHFEGEGNTLRLKEIDDFQLEQLFSIAKEGETSEPELRSGETETTESFSEESGPFSRKAFQLLEGLHQTPRKSYYEEKKEAIDEHLRQPFQAFFKSIADELPPAITNRLETEKYLFGRILKNDFGQGGAWDYYWGAFYPKGKRRTESAQLYLTIKRKYVRFGFSIGEKSGDPARRFQQNVEQFGHRLEALLADSMGNDDLLFGHPDEEWEVEENGSVQGEGRRSFSEWFDQIQETSIRAYKVLSKQQVLAASSEKLRSQVASVFKQVFPLMLLAMREDPLPILTEYLQQPVRREEDEPNPTYDLDAISRKTGIGTSTFQQWNSALQRKKQAIFYGPPGTGKTFLARKLAKHLIGGGYGFADLVQFHPSYAYEDFMQGLRPKKDENRNLSYEMEAGRFLTFCDRAENREDPCVLIIDEINRANLSRVFGELMYLLEYRNESVELAGGTAFSIPENVYLIGTMNTADRSIALVDHALRRRFAFLPLFPRMKVLRRFHERKKTGFDVEPLIELLEEVNRAIDDQHYHVGPSYFLREDLTDELDAIWQYEIVPYLEEYFFGEPESVDRFRWNNVRDRLDLTA